MKKPTKTPVASHLALTASRTSKKPLRPLDATLSAWESTRPLREQIPTESLRAFNFDYTAAVLVMQQARRDLLPMRDRFVTALPEFEIRALDELDTYCNAALYAHARVQPSTQAPPATELITAADAHYGKLMRWCAPLVDQGLVDATALDEIRKGTGWRDRAEDLRALVVLLSKRWKEICACTALADADLDTAIALADQLLAHLARKDKPEGSTDEQLDRRRAMSVAMSAYEQVRRAVTWLRWDEGDAEELAPSVYRSPFARAPKREAEKENEGEKARERDDDEQQKAEKEPASTQREKEPAAKKRASAAEKRVAEKMRKAQEADDEGPTLGADGKPLVPQDNPFITEDE